MFAALCAEVMTMKFFNCPECGNRAFDNILDLIRHPKSQEDFISCLNCGASIDHSRTHIVFVGIINLIVYLAGTAVLLQHGELYVYIFTALMCVISPASLILLTPLKAFHKEPHKPPTVSGGDKLITWHRSPVVILGFLLILVLIAMSRIGS